MGTISQVEEQSVASVYDTSTKKAAVSGRTIGNPQLSDKASKYYEELKRKFSDMDFVLVSEDQKEQAKAQTANFANSNRMVVLIDEDKIEKMANDKNYKKQYESIIRNSSSQMNQLKMSLDNSSQKVKSFGMQINDNGAASFFATIDKDFKASSKEIEKKAEAKKAQKKADAKKAEKKQANKQLEDKMQKAHEVKPDSDIVTVTASSIDELLQKIEDESYADMSDRTQLNSEKQIGQHIDYRM